MATILARPQTLEQTQHGKADSTWRQGPHSPRWRKREHQDKEWIMTDAEKARKIFDILSSICLDQCCCGYDYECSFCLRLERARQILTGDNE